VQITTLKGDLKRVTDANVELKQNLEKATDDNVIISRELAAQKAEVEKQKEEVTKQKNIVTQLGKDKSTLAETIDGFKKSIWFSFYSIFNPKK
jgi:chromosome segregation ATPase